MRDPKDFQFDLPRSGSGFSKAAKRPEQFLLNEKIHKRAWDAAPSATSPRPGDALESVRVFVIHATAGSSTEGAVSVIEDARASFHWIVPDEDEDAHGAYVWATAPEKRTAWHVRYNCSHPDVCRGSKGLNALSLGLEVVNAQSGGDAFSEWQVKASAEIVRYAWAKYPNLRHVVSHARLDPDRRSDPGTAFPWEEFEALVLKG